jgi:hypothetical protein
MVTFSFEFGYVGSLIIREFTMSNSVISVTFATESGSLTQKSIQSIKVLHYKSISARLTETSEAEEPATQTASHESFDNFAEIVLFYDKVGQDEMDLSRTVIQRKYINLIL